MPRPEAFSTFPRPDTVFLAALVTTLADQVIAFLTPRPLALKAFPRPPTTFFAGPAVTLAVHLRAFPMPLPAFLANPPKVLIAFLASINFLGMLPITPKNCFAFFTANKIIRASAALLIAVLCFPMSNKALEIAASGSFIAFDLPVSLPKTLTKSEKIFFICFQISLPKILAI